MADKLEGEGPSGRARATKEKVPAAPKPPTKPRRKAETPTVTDDLTGKFLRVGNKLYRRADDRTPIVELEPDRLKTRNVDALPDIIRIAKANGWTSIRIAGGDTFRKAAFLAAASQGLDVENYTPSKVVKAEADRLRARVAAREARRADAKPATGASPAGGNADAPRVLAERFLRQSHEQNVRDPELKNAQTLVAAAMAIARARHPGDPEKVARAIEAKRNDVAQRIARGDVIAAVAIRDRQAERVREQNRDLAMHRSGRSC